MPSPEIEKSKHSVVVPPLSKIGALDKGCDKDFDEGFLLETSSNTSALSTLNVRAVCSRGVLQH
jgi:hypothetical protein